MKKKRQSFLNNRSTVFLDYFRIDILGKDIEKNLLARANADVFRCSCDPLGDVFNLPDELERGFRFDTFTVSLSINESLLSPTERITSN